MDREALLSTNVLALDNVPSRVLNNPILRIEELPIENMTVLRPLGADEGTFAQVRAAVSAAEKAGRKASKAFRSKHWPNGHVADACGYAYVRTRTHHSKVTAALLKMGLAHPLEYGGYELHGLDFKIREQSIQIEQAGASAAARVLTEFLGQDFYMWSRLD